ncbi:4-alpha-glucanotransferase, partial [Haemophilus influenzae]
FWRFGCFD